MCGVRWILDRGQTTAGPASKPASKKVLNIPEAMARRGPDSTSVALFGPAESGRLHNKREAQTREVGAWQS